MTERDDITLNVRGMGQWFGNNRVLYDIDLQVVRGQFVAIVGGSGCGKSTLFRAVLGTDPPKAGHVETGGIRVNGPNRHVGIVYQQYRLYQFLTAEENVAFGPMLDSSGFFERALMPWKWWPKRRRQLQAARDLLTKVKLGHALKSYPHQLSGGMQQRVAIAQSLIMEPNILLLDEPFGALDEATRESLQKMLLHLYQENIESKQRGEQPRWTVVFITHELNEAFYVSDRVVGLSRNWFEETPSGIITGATLGATKVWDKCAPVYHPDAPKDFELFYEAKRELRDVVLNDKAAPVERNKHVSYWSDLSKGVGTGVAMVRN